MIRVKLTDIKISKPAISALQEIGIEYLDELRDFSESDLLKLHGFGKKGLSILSEILKENGLSLKR